MGERPRGRGTIHRVCLTLLACLSVVVAFAAPVAAVEPTTMPAPEAPTAPTTPPAETDATAAIEAVVASARAYLGTPYRIGSEGPGLFDCSGLIYRVFAETGNLDRVGGTRLRAAGYLRWFAERERTVATAEYAARGDLVVFGRGEHIGIYLGDGRVLSALTSGVATHSLYGITLPPTAFLKVDWTGDGGTPIALPDNYEDIPETPVSLVEAAPWVPIPDPDAALNQPGPAHSERVDMRTAISRTFQNSDGTFTTELHARPIFYQPAGSTDWRPIDLRLESVANAAGARVTKSPVQLSVAASGAASAFLSLAADDRQVALALAGRSPRTPSSPVVSIDGAFADYFDFLAPGVGLRVFPRADGFRSFLVLERKPRTNQFSFSVAAPGLTLLAEEDGSASLRDEAGVAVGHLPRPLLLDSSDVDGDGGGVFTAATRLSVATGAVAPVLTITIERRYLDEAVYPSFVDLSLIDFPGVTAGADLTFASSRHPNTSFERYQRPEGAAYAELWQGRQPGSRADNEVYLRFPGIAATVGTVDVAEAALELFPYWQRDDEDAATVVRRVTEEWDAAALTWNARPTTGEAGTAATSAPGTWAQIDVSDYVSDVILGAEDFGLLLAGDGSGASTWKRFVADGQAGEFDLGPRLSVTWSGLRPAGVAAAPDLTTLSPVARWTHAGVAPDQRRFQVEVSRDDFATLTAASGIVKGRRGLASEWAVPARGLADGATYEWRVRVKYAGERAWSEWSAPQSFTFGQPKVEADPF